MDSTNRKPVANIAPFGLRMQPELKRRVEEAATANARSLNAEIVSRLEASFYGGGKTLSFLKPGKTATLEKRLEQVEERLAKLEGRK